MCVKFFAMYWTWMSIISFWVDPDSLTWMRFITVGRMFIHLIGKVKSCDFFHSSMNQLPDLRRVKLLLMFFQVRYSYNLGKTKIPTLHWSFGCIQQQQSYNPSRLFVRNEEIADVVLWNYCHICHHYTLYNTKLSLFLVLPFPTFRITKWAPKTTQSGRK